MLALLIVLAMAMVMAPLLVHWLKDRAGLVLALGPASGFVWLAFQVPDIAQGHILAETLSWAPLLGVSVDLRLDGLSLLFALMILGIGTLIVLYTRAYLEDHHHLGRFFAYLLGFMLAMLGMVLSDNLIGFFVFWELTSVASFLLIGFFHTHPDSRRSALQALLITGGGGLALLAGLLLLGSAAQAWQFSALEREVLAQSPLIGAISVLILLGCFTKSAQWPFHLWLPNAMAAPTPVSAYLHSATMVKAGIYLLARLNPTLGGPEGWGAVLMVVGSITAVLGAILAIRQTDLKRLLAYTTVAVLGQLTLLLGTNTAYGLQAFVVYLLAHASYKAALFMAVGAIDHATGTREVGRLGGLAAFMPLTAGAVGLAAFSNAGLPPAFGFIAKEFKYAGLLTMGIEGLMVTMVMILTNALLLASAGILFFKAFFGKPGNYPQTPHEVPISMWIGPALLAVLGFLLGAFHGLPERWLVGPAVLAMAQGPVDVNLYLWGGLTPAVVASVITVGLGVLAYRYHIKVKAHLAAGGRHLPLNADQYWDRFLHALFAMAGHAASFFQHGSLRGHLLALLAVIGLFALVAGSWAGLNWAVILASPVSFPGLFGCLLALVGALASTQVRGRLAMAALMGLSGLGVALFFFSARAPDVAMTQIMVEALTVLFLAMVLSRLPASKATGSGSRLSRRVRLGVALLFGLGMAVMLLSVLSAPLPTLLADTFMARSLPDGVGSNVVNVILVDFRAMDTLGEVAVVALSALGAAALLSSKDAAILSKTRTRPQHSFSLDAFASPLLAPVLPMMAGLMLLVSLMILWRGHNLPGGGFIGGLVAASGIALLMIGRGSGAIPTPIVGPWPSSSGLVLLGLTVATGAGLFGLLISHDYLEALWLKALGLPLGTPLLFDMGVYLTVTGSVLHVLQALLPPLSPVVTPQKEGA
jgi:multicomponent Na+:H+ antiporter subunit A